MLESSTAMKAPMVVFVRTTYLYCNWGGSLARTNRMWIRLWPQKATARTRAPTIRIPPAKSRGEGDSFPSAFENICVRRGERLVRMTDNATPTVDMD